MIVLLVKRGGGEIWQSISGKPGANQFFLEATRSDHSLSKSSRWAFLSLQLSNLSMSKIKWSDGNGLFSEVMWYRFCLDSRYHRYWCDSLDWTIIDDVLRSFVFSRVLVGFHDFPSYFPYSRQIIRTSHKCGEVCYFFVHSHGWLACVPHQEHCFTNRFVHSHPVPQINRVPHQQRAAEERLKSTGIFWLRKYRRNFDYCPLSQFIVKVCLFVIEVFNLRITISMRACEQSPDPAI